MTHDTESERGLPELPVSDFRLDGESERCYYESSMLAYALAAIEKDRASRPSPVAQDGDWVALTDDDRDRAFQTLPDMLEGFMKKWGWLHYAKAIEAVCREKNAAAPLSAPKADEENGWRTIESAPKDGREMYVVKGFNVTNPNCGVNRYTTDPYCVWTGDEGGWVRWPHPFPPTHWMPLPPAPTGVSHD